MTLLLLIDLGSCGNSTSCCDALVPLPLTMRGQWRPATVTLQSRLMMVTTLDDGYDTLLQNAVPELQKRKIPATIFVVAGRLGEYAGWPGYPGRFMSAEQLCSLPVILAGFSVSSRSVPVAAVAVGMWKPAFCAGFQAPRAGRKRCGQSPSIPPSERHFHSKPSILKHFGETVPFGKQFFAKCVPFRKPRKTSTSPDSRSEPYLRGMLPRQQQMQHGLAT
jgi:hypothetical protein